MKRQDQQILRLRKDVIDLLLVVTTARDLIVILIWNGKSN